MPKFCKARDVMRSSLITARPDMTAEELKELLVMNRISGAPVVDHDGRLVGVISMSDILSSAVDMPFQPNYFEASQLDRILEREGFHLETITSGYVEDYMTREVVKAQPDTPVDELAEIMYEHHIHRLVIVKPPENKLVGIVTTFDLLKAIIDRRKVAAYQRCSPVGASANS